MSSTLHSCCGPGVMGGTERNLRAVLLAASPPVPAKTRVVLVRRCETSEKERSPGLGTQQERLKNEAGES